MDLTNYVKLPGSELCCPLVEYSVSDNLGTVCFLIPISRQNARTFEYSTLTNCFYSRERLVLHVRELGHTQLIQCDILSINHRPALRLRCDEVSCFIRIELRVSLGAPALSALHE